MDPELAPYVESVALHWEHQGMPRIAGRILGYLLVCHPPWRSAGQLVDELEVSKSSVSTMVRLLVSSGTVQTHALPGDRATYYQVTPEGLRDKFAERVAAMVAFRALAEEGLALLEDEPPERSRRLRQVASLYRFLERELPLLLDRWEAEDV